MFQSVELFSIPLLNLGLLLGAFALLLGGAEIFTNSIDGSVITPSYEHSPIVTADNTLTLLKEETGIG